MWKRNHGTYASAMEQIADKAWSLFEAILSESVIASRKNILEYAALDKKQLSDLCRSRWKLEDGTESAIRIRTRRKHKNHEAPNEIPLSVGIKEMPAYDPDMELRGLTLTIPTWIMAITRVEKKTESATEKARTQLAQSLVRLEEQIDELLGVMGYGR